MYTSLSISISICVYLNCSFFCSSPVIRDYIQKGIFGCPSLYVSLADHCSAPLVDGPPTGSHWLVVLIDDCISGARIPSGKCLHNCGKSLFFMGKSTINGNFQ